MSKSFQVLGINHLGCVAKDAKQARWFFNDFLKLDFEGEELVKDQSTNTLMFLCPPSATRVELLEPHDNFGPIQTYMEKKGGGIHHLALTVDSVEEAIQSALKSGVTMIDKVPRKGAHNTRIAFVHPKSTGGFLVEFVQESST